MARIVFRIQDCNTPPGELLHNVDEDMQIESFSPLRGMHRAGDLEVGDKICILTNVLDRGCEILEINP